MMFCILLVQSIFTFLIVRGLQIAAYQASQPAQSADVPVGCAIMLLLLAVLVAEISFATGFVLTLVGA